MPTTDHQEFFDFSAQAKYHTHSMLLWPVLWKRYKGRKNLRWKRIPFRKSSRSKVPRRPGVYAFLVKPSIASLDVAYLMYIGKATTSLRDRFGQYLTSERNPYTGRPKMATLLHQYGEHLQFRFATLRSASTVSKIEPRLIAAFKPPVNEQVEAMIRRPTSAF